MITQKLADELEIRNLVARLHQLADYGPDLVEYLECYAEDATWEFADSGATDNDRYVGIKEIERHKVELRDAGFQGLGTHTRHVNTNLVVTVHDDGTATAHSYWFFYRNTADTPVLALAGRYHDDFRKTESGWRYTHRRAYRG